MQPSFPMLIVLGSLLLSSPVPASQSASVLLEKAIYAEQTVGDLAQAVEIYRKIIDDAEANRRHVAQAYYRLAMCYVKQGRTIQAHDLLRKLVKRFPEETALVAEAGKYLPRTPFPELVGCRVKETVFLSISADTADKAPESEATTYEYGCLEIQWDVDPKLAERVGTFTVSIRPAKKGAQAVWSASDVAAGARSIICGVGKPGDKPAEVHLKPGVYEVTVDANKGSDRIGRGLVRLRVKPLPMTQIMVDDIQADGTISFRNIGQRVNASDQPLRATGFCNSDFIEIQRMTDDRGRELKFTVKHDGETYRYNVALNEPVPPGGAVITSSEGTASGQIAPVAGQKDELEYRMQHWPSAGQAVRRIEVYRLPEGAELLETTPRDMSRRTRDGRIELFVEKMIPADDSILTAFRYRLPGASVAAKDRAEPVAAPWVDGEVMRLRLNSAAGGELGSMWWTADAAKSGGQAIWRIESYMVITTGDMRQFTRVDAKEPSFLPTTARTKNWMGDFRATYAGEKVDLTMFKGGKVVSSRQVKTPERVYDNEQAIALIRRLPLRKGYHTSFMIFPVTGGVVVECRIKVIEQEKVTVPAGTFDAYRMTLQIYAGRVKALEHTLWISADKHRYLVKYDAGAALMELVEAYRRETGQPTSFRKESLGISLDLPSGWLVYESPAPGTYRWLAYLLPPELKASSSVVANEAPAETPSVRAIAEAEVQRVGSALSGYKVRPDSWAEAKVAGLPSISCVADYTDKDVEMVEYRTYILDRSMLYWLECRTAKSECESVRPEFDKIVKTFSVKKGG
ncbi:MAG: DUF3108 domain-containing protein [Phycisphaerae bacterium]|nr:DUF3108 domain-containing protein [Phycisphaerae bacterium]